MIYFIADTHFNHVNIIKYCNRPFKDITEMNEAMIKNWNSVVKPEDTVWHLGDFALGGFNFCKDILQNLNGQKYLIRGNHDKRISKEKWIKAGFVNVFDCDYIQLLISNKSLIESFFEQDFFVLLLSHKPINQTINNLHFGFNIHGHTHDKQLDRETCFCVSVEMIDYKPISSEEILQKMLIIKDIPENIALDQY